jgi:hypothetical protein
MAAEATIAVGSLEDRVSALEGWRAECEAGDPEPDVVVVDAGDLDDGAPPIINPDVAIVVEPEKDEPAKDKPAGGSKRWGNQGWFAGR